MTVITGTACRAYELAARFRGRGIAVVLGRRRRDVNSRRMPSRMRTPIVTGYAEESLAAVASPDLPVGVAVILQKRYTQEPWILNLRGLHISAPRSVARASGIPHDQCLSEATRGCGRQLRLLPWFPAAWGRSRCRSRRRMWWPTIYSADTGRRRALFVDLNLISGSRNTRYGFFTGSCGRWGIKWYGLSTGTCWGMMMKAAGVAGRSGCRGC